MERSDKVFRVIDPAYGKDNIYRHAARRTVSLGPVMIASVAHKALPWLQAEVITENNYRRGRKGPRDADGRPDHLGLQQEKYADFIGISASITNAVPRALEIIKAYRAMPEELRPQAIIVGGWHAGDLPGEFFEAGADVVVHGEGVAVLKQVIEAFDSGRGLEEIPGISWRDNGEVRRNNPDFLAVSEAELNSYPPPNFDLVRYAKLKVIPVSRTWGCSGKCRFCRVKAAPRALAPERFAQHIKELISKGHRHFFLVDDRSEEDMEGFTAWLEEIARFREERNIRRLHFTVQARLSLAEKPDVLKLMRRAGIKTVAIGFESPIPEEIWAMRKPVVPDKMIEWTHTWRKHGFFVHAMLILGYPLPPDKAQPRNAKGEPMSARERANEFWRFLKAARPDTIQILALTPIPGTEDWEYLEAQNRIYTELGWGAWDGLHVVFEPDPPMTAKDLQEEVVRLHRKFYAFRYLGGLGFVSLFAHLLAVGVTTVSMPFVWLFILPAKWPRCDSFKEAARRAWQVPSGVARRARRHFQAYLIVEHVERKIKGFNRQLEDVLRRRKTV